MAGGGGDGGAAAQMCIRDSAEVANGLMGTGARLGVIPLGTANVSVSYTHLDVYKRQFFSTATRPT